MPASAQKAASHSIPVTPDNFPRAESDLFMGNIVKEGSLGKLIHRREPADIDNQTVVRINRDTLYSTAVIDLDAGPVTVTLPDAGKRFMSLQVINEDHYVVTVVYGAGKTTIDKAKAETRYILIAIRTLVDPANPEDVTQVHTLQDAIKIEQTSSGSFDVPNWDQASQAKVREALLALNATISSVHNAFGKKAEVDPVYHLIGTASG